MESRRMYRVEKFLPTECPKCQTRFLVESRDYGRFLRLHGAASASADYPQRE